MPSPSREEIRDVYLAHRVFEAGIIAELARSYDQKTLDLIEAHLEKERAAGAVADRAASVSLSGEFHMLLVDSLGSPELSRFLRELLARSSLMVSAFEPARLSICGIDEHAAIAAALKARDPDRAIALSSEHFRHIEERVQQGIVERSDREIEDALQFVGGKRVARERCCARQVYIARTPPDSSTPAYDLKSRASTREFGSAGRDPQAPMWTAAPDISR